MSSVYTAIYYVIYVIFYPLLRLLFPVKVVGVERLPKGKAILCPNHSNALDPLTIVISLKKLEPVHMMAKAQLFYIPIVGMFLRCLNAYSVKRETSDLKSFKKTIRFLESNEKVLMFPEGTRVKYRGEVAAKAGCALFSAKTDAPLIPVYCQPGRKFLRKSLIVFGEPFYPTFSSKRPTTEENLSIAGEVLNRAYDLGENYVNR